MNKSIFYMPIGEAITEFNKYALCMEANNVDIGLGDKSTWEVFGEWFTAERLREIELSPKTLGL